MLDLADAGRSATRARSRSCAHLTSHERRCGASASRSCSGSGSYAVARRSGGASGSTRLGSRAAAVALSQVGPALRRRVITNVFPTPVARCESLVTLDGVLESALSGAHGGYNRAYYVVISVGGAVPWTV